MRPVSYIAAPLLVGFAYAIPFTGIRRKQHASLHHHSLFGSVSLNDAQDTTYFANV
jgi:hypothetical protein